LKKKLPSAAASASHVVATKDRQFVTALARGLEILTCFTAATPELSGSEIAKRTGLAQPTVWRLCHTMLKMGMLVTVAGDKLRPGLPALRLGHSAIAGLGLLDLARPHLQDIASRFGAACGLATRDKLNMVFVERREGQNQLLLNLRIGSTVPIATSAFGWAYLAGLPATARAQVIREIQRHDPDVWAKVKPAFNRALAEYRETGLILNAAVFHKAYNTLAVPIVLPDGSVPYCLNCGSAVSTLSEKALRKEVAPRLLELAGLLQDFLSTRT
jgi:DNA-binding IclR family transcriptional regulator